MKGPVTAPCLGPPWAQNVKNAVLVLVGVGLARAQLEEGWGFEVLVDLWIRIPGSKDTHTAPIKGGVVCSGRE